MYRINESSENNEMREQEMSEQVIQIRAYDNLRLNEGEPNDGPNDGDKRPIAKFYRSWRQDVNRGQPLEQCRGINLQQYIAADKLSSSYESSMGSSNPGFALVHDRSYSPNRNNIEHRVHKRRRYSLIMARLSKNSKAIIEHVCINEQPVRQYELQQIPRWVKGAGTARLREALDELIEIYRKLN